MAAALLQNGCSPAISFSPAYLAPRVAPLMPAAAGARAGREETRSPSCRVYRTNTTQPCSTLGPYPLIFRAKLMIRSSLLGKFLKTKALCLLFPLSSSPKVV